VKNPTISFFLSLTQDKTFFSGFYADCLTSKTDHGCSQIPPGEDHINAGTGDDRIFCEDKGEMVDLVEAGETAETTPCSATRMHSMAAPETILPVTGSV